MEQLKNNMSLKVQTNLRNIKNQRGSVLILTIWTLLFLSTLTVVFGSTAGQQIIMAKKIEERSKLYDLAYSGVLMAMDIMSSSGERDLTPGGDALNDFWANDPGVFRSVRLGGGVFNFKYEYLDNISNSKKIFSGVVDEDRKLNLNYASKGSIGRLLMEAAGIDAIRAGNIADAIIDWRDADDVLNNTDEDVSEREWYLNEGYEYFPENQYFSVLEELLLVKGVNTEIFLKIRDYVTVFGDSTVNINTASRPVLEALGLDEELADKIILFRSGMDMAEGTMDDNIFYSTNDVLKDLDLNVSLSDMEIDELTALITGRKINTRSDTFNVLCSAGLDAGRIYGNITCIFDRNGRIQYWGWRLQEGSV